MKEHLRAATLCLVTAFFVTARGSDDIQTQAVKGSLLGAVTDNLSYRRKQRMALEAARQTTKTQN